MKTAVIVCNGENPLQEDLKFYWEKSDLKVAADGGAIILKEYGFVPDRIIGDLDSWDHHSFLDIPVIRVEEQNTNDADKAIRYCIEQGIEEIALLGAHGKRSDQFVANLEVLYKYSSWIKVKLITNVDVIEVVRNQWEENLLVGTTLSLLPIFGIVEKITTTGLKFPLHNSSLEWGVPPSGVSNQVIATEVKIELQSNFPVLLIHQKPI